MDNKYVDMLLFFGVLFFSQLIVQHGKALTSYLFSTGIFFCRSSYMSVENILILIITVSFLLLLRYKKMMLVNKVFISSIVGGLGAFLPIFVSDTPSMLIFLLQIYLYAVATIIICIEPLLSKDMEKEFWKMLFEYMTKLTRYFLVLYIALIAVLKYISSGVHENAMGFMTTLLYPTIVVIISFFMIGYWVMLPTWNKIIRGYSKSRNNRFKVR